MDVKLYVGNLSYSTTEDDLRTLFAEAGDIVSVSLSTDRNTGRSKGFAFVEMKSQVEAEKAITMFNGSTLGDRELKVNVAKSREDRGDRRGKPGRQSGRKRY